MSRVWPLLLLLLPVIASAQQPIVPAGEVTEERWFVYASLLTSTDSDRLRLAAKLMVNEPVHDRRLTDMVAKVLWEQLNGTRLVNVDTLAWLAKSLAPSGSQRYRPLLEQLVSAKPGSVAKHASVALVNLTRTEDPFVIEDVDAAAIQSQLSHLKMMVRERTLFAASTGMRLEDVVREFGFPASVDVALHSRPSRLTPSVSSHTLSLEYPDRGTIEFTDRQGDWRSSLITPVLLERQLTDAADNVIEIRKGLLAQEYSVSRHYATRVVHEEVFDATTMELAAWRLLSHTDAENAFLVDGLAHLCAALAKAGDPRYRATLERVATDATNPKLKRHAAEALKKLPPAAVEQFDGDIGS